MKKEVHHHWKQIPSFLKFEYFFEYKYNPLFIYKPKFKPMTMSSNKKSKPINLITCMKFFKSVLNNATEFAEGSDLKSLDDINTARSNYCQLKWMKAIVDDMSDKITDALETYDKKIEPIIQDVTEAIDDINDRTIYDMWDINYYDQTDDNKIPDEVKKSWADTTDYEDARKHLKAMKDKGYPDINNIRPIKELKSPTTEKAEHTFSEEQKLINDDDDDYYPNRTFYHQFELNGALINLPVVQYLDDIKPCFHYYDGDKKHGAGIYMSPFPGVIMQVPFASVIPYSMENSNYYSMKCTAGKNCKNYKCTYAHPGTDYVKIGCVSRCPKAHGFGDKNSIAEDLKAVSIEDIRIVSFYGLNDLFSSALWFAKKISGPGLRIIHDLEVCDNYTDEEFMKSDEYQDSDRLDD